MSFKALAVLIDRLQHYDDRPTSMPKKPGLVSEIKLSVFQGGEEQRGPITAEERQRLKRDVEAFVSSPDPEGSLPLRASMLEMREVLSVFKEVCLAYKAAQGSQATTRPYTPGYSGTPAVELKGVQALQDEVQKLRLQVQQRDNEITILVSMLKKHAPPSMLGANAGSVSANAGSVSHDTPPPSKTQKLAQMEMLPSNNASAGGLRRAATCNGQPETCSASGQGEAVNLQASKAAGGSGEVLLDVSVLQDRNRAFELFRKSYRRNAAIENSTAVRSCYL
jgi:kinesin family protein 6/9